MIEEGRTPLETLPTAVRKTVERHLREYKANKAAVASYPELRESILYGAPARPEGPAPEGSVGDPSGVKAVKLAELDRRIRQKAVIVAAIDDVLQSLSDEDLRLIELRYFSGFWFTTARMARELNMGRTAYYRRLNRLLRLFALRLGLL